MGTFQEEKKQAIDALNQRVSEVKKARRKAGIMALIPGPGWLKRLKMYQFELIRYRYAMIALIHVHRQVPPPPPDLFLQQGGVINQETDKGW